MEQYVAVARPASTAQAWVRSYFESLALTAICSFFVYLILRRPGLIGIDDANITQVYASNIFAGHGYVYNSSGERVEGATSLLWVAINALAFVSSSPEHVVLVIGALATAAGVSLTRNLYATLAQESSSRWLIGERAFMVVAFAAMPSFFAWGVVTLMEVGLWCALFVAYTAVLASYTIELSRTSRLAGNWPRDVALLVAMVLCRPEALAVACLALVVFVGVNVYRAPRETGMLALRRAFGHGATIAAAQVGVTVFRLVYFGFPFPNTYYAKVSSNPLDNLKSGGRYLAIFLGDQYLMPLFVCGLAFVLMKVIDATFEKRQAASRAEPPTVYTRTLALVAGLCLDAVVIPIIMGGDHFGSQRFFQPTFPLLGIFAAIALNDAAATWLPRPGKGSVVVASVASLALIGGASVAFFDRSKLLKEFDLCKDGRRLGAALQSLFPGGTQPSVGVITAGGIHRTYEGPVYDLLALNWVEMAHATGRRQGFRNHSAFNAHVFWEHLPDIVTPSFVQDAASAATVRISMYLGSIEGEERFHQDYRVVLWSVEGGAFLTGFVSTRLVPLLSPQNARVIPWQDVVELPPPPRQ